MEPEKGSGHFFPIVIAIPGSHKIRQPGNQGTYEGQNHKKIPQLTGEGMLTNIVYLHYNNRKTYAPVAFTLFCSLYFDGHFIRISSA